MAGTAPNYDNVMLPGADGIRIPTEVCGVDGPAKNGGTMTIQRLISLDFGGAHAGKTLNAPQSAASVILCTNADATATTVTFPASQPGKIFVVNNTSTSAITFLVTGQTGIQVATGKSATLYMNATDVARASADV